MADRYYLEVAEDSRVLFRFDNVVNRGSIPDSAKPVSPEVFAKTLERREGVPYLLEDGSIEFKLLSGMTPDERQARMERAWRDNELLRTGGLRDRHRDEAEIGIASTLSDDQYSELLGYIQALRAWPQSEYFPLIEHRPAPPFWLAEQTQ
ncbi:phage tail protein [Pseudomonas protegens]|uniref:phage tail protein n=1 Tax=Pseudomonas protegens TaxID=380021 RepID=UPI002DB9467D|nr:phage tail protein [Pseudomonas protegens]WRV92899.1 phage tail protein [Pseudomonas protegens]